MSKRSLLSLALLTALAPLGATAAPECRCRANGGFFELGDVVCISLPSGNKLAQCAMALNNTTWRVLEESCPTASLAPRPEATLQDPAGRLAMGDRRPN